MWSLIGIHQIAFEKMGGQKIQAADPETWQTHIAAHFVGANKKLEAVNVHMARLYGVTN